MAWLPSIRTPGGALSWCLAAFVALLLVLSGCASSRDPTMARIFEAPNVIHVCVRPSNVPKDKRIWAVTSAGSPFFGTREVDQARGNGSNTVYVFDLDAPPESVRLLPIPYNKLECPARILSPRILPPKPEVVAAKEKEKEPEKEKGETKKAERPKPLPRPIARSPGRCPEPGQARRRGGTGARTCSRTLVYASERSRQPSFRRAEDPPAAEPRPVPPPLTEPRPVPRPKPVELVELPERVAQEYEDWRITPADVFALAADRARECLDKICHARHKNFIPKDKKKPAETHKGQSLSTGSGSGGGASPSRPGPKPAAKPAPKRAPKPAAKPAPKPPPKPAAKPARKPAPKTTVKTTTKPAPKTTVKTTTKPVGKPNGAAAGQAKATGSPDAGAAAKAARKPHQPDLGKWKEKGGTVRDNPDGTRTFRNKDGVEVKYDKDGFADFSPHRHPEVKDVKIEFTGNYRKDNQLADRAAGITEDMREKQKYTWHHHQDGKTMQLIKYSIHKDFYHTGGMSGAR